VERGDSQPRRGHEVAGDGSIVAHLDPFGRGLPPIAEVFDKQCQVAVMVGLAYLALERTRLGQIS
jgi:hypothetical protein